MSDIKKCPFCGQDPTDRKGHPMISYKFRRDIPVPGWSIWCTVCDAIGPCFPAKTQALAAWNSIERKKIHNP